MFLISTHLSTFNSYDLRRLYFRHLILHRMLLAVPFLGFTERLHKLGSLNSQRMGLAWTFSRQEAHPQHGVHLSVGSLPTAPRTFQTRWIVWRSPTQLWRLWVAMLSAQALEPWRFLAREQSMLFPMW